MLNPSEMIPHMREQRNSEEGTPHHSVRWTNSLPSDVQLTEQVEQALRSRGYRCLQEIKVLVHEELVILGGRVHSYYLKQLAQEAVLALPGNHCVHNNVEVIQRQ